MEARPLLWICFSVCCIHTCTWCLELGTFVTATSRSCASLCSYQSRCRSSDWDASKQSCRLSTDGVVGSEVNLQRPGHVCDMRPCPEDLVCVPTESGKSYLCLRTPFSDAVKTGDCYLKDGYLNPIQSPGGFKFDASMTWEFCDEFCTNLENAYFGLVGAIACYCGDVIISGFEKTTASNCSLPCPGNAAQKCGGVNAMLIYKTDDYP